MFSAFVFIILCRPHLMLSNLGTDERIALGQLVDLFHDIRTGQTVLDDSGAGTCLSCAQCWLIHSSWFIGSRRALNLRRTILTSPITLASSVDIFVDLRRIDIDLKNLCIACKLVRIAGNTVTEAGAYHDQEITLTHPKVGCLGSVHTEHTGIKVISSVKCTLSHQESATGAWILCANALSSSACIGKHCSAADENKRLLRSSIISSAFSISSSRMVSV